MLLWHHSYYHYYDYYYDCHTLTTHTTTTTTTTTSTPSPQIPTGSAAPRPQGCPQGLSSLSSADRATDVDQGLKSIPSGNASGVRHPSINAGDCLHREVESPVVRRVSVQGDLYEPRIYLGESQALPSDEVNMPELDVTLHGCKGGPVMGIPREPLVCSPRGSNLGASGDPLGVTSLRCVAEELKAASVTIDPKEVLKEFVTRFQHRADPKPKVPGGTKKPEAKHFALGTHPITPPLEVTRPPGLGTREYPHLSSIVPPRHEEKVIAQSNRNSTIKRNMRCLFGQ